MSKTSDDDAAETITITGLTWLPMPYEEALRRIKRGRDVEVTTTVIGEPAGRDTTLDGAIAHWGKLADDEEVAAAWEVKMGRNPVSFRNRVATYRRTVEALRLQVQNGIWHCVCCLSPQGTR